MRNHLNKQHKNIMKYHFTITTEFDLETPFSNSLNVSCLSDNIKDAIISNITAFEIIDENNRVFYHPEKIQIKVMQMRDDHIKKYAKTKFNKKLYKKVILHG